MNSENDVIEQFEDNSCVVGETEQSQDTIDQHESHCDNDMSLYYQIMSCKDR